MMPSLGGGIMITKSKHAIRMDFANAIRDRYAAANKDKRRILEEFIGGASRPAPYAAPDPSYRAGNILDEADGSKIT